jgi:hypothetical protein
MEKGWEGTRDKGTTIKFMNIQINTPYNIPVNVSFNKGNNDKKTNLPNFSYAYAI